MNLYFRDVSHEDILEKQKGEPSTPSGLEGYERALLRLCSVLLRRALGCSPSIAVYMVSSERLNASVKVLSIVHVGPP